MKNTPHRILLLDVIRGIAILGILLMNIQSFGLISSAYTNPTANGSLNSMNQTIWILIHLLSDQKFINIFSILFGAGIILLWEKTELKEISFPKLMRQRMFWLLVIGMIHAYFIWYGDILVTYSIVGLIAMLFRKLTITKLKFWGLLFYLIPVLLYLLMGWSVQYWPQESITDAANQWQPGSGLNTQEVEAMRGTYLEQMKVRATLALSLQVGLFFIYSLWKCLGLMLIGMALYKSGFFFGNLNRKKTLLLIAFGLTLGSALALSGIYQNFGHNWSFEYSMFYGSAFNYSGSLLMSLAYLGIIVVLVKIVRKAKPLNWFSNVGRTALSNYLLQSIICTTLFYGHGFGLFNRMDLWQLYLLVPAIWLFQIMMTNWWLIYHKQGPVEWLWRKLAYRSSTSKSEKS
jgi:uncharacterized protein